jgi:hypothetical protein
VVAATFAQFNVIEVGYNPAQMQGLDSRFPVPVRNALTGHERERSADLQLLRAINPQLLLKPTL